MPRIMANLTGLCPDVGGTPAATWPCPWAEMRGGVGIGEGRFFGRNVRTNQDGEFLWYDHGFAFEGNFCCCRAIRLANHHFKRRFGDHPSFFSPTIKFWHVFPTLDVSDISSPSQMLEKRSFWCEDVSVAAKNHRNLSFQQNLQMLRFSSSVQLNPMSLFTNKRAKLAAWFSAKKGFQSSY